MYGDGEWEEVRTLGRILQDFGRGEGDRTKEETRRRFDEVPSTRPRKERLSLEQRTEMVVHRRGSLVGAVREAGPEDGLEAVVCGLGCEVLYLLERELRKIRLWECGSRAGRRDCRGYDNRGQTHQNRRAQVALAPFRLLVCLRHPHLIKCSSTSTKKLLNKCL